ncbi:MAG TPA: phosphate ABC transporter permease subunit PstC [Solirubrobacteraceae bacterium]|nr:phosphate ABC transporter permease subunit PstC [Solirubrobacteraceae bacterium]
MASRDISAAVGPAAPARPPLTAAPPRFGERALIALLALCGVVSVATTVGIIVALAEPTVEFFGEIPFGDFFSADAWAPTFANPTFGVLEIVLGTLNVTLWAILAGIPLGLGAAVYLSEYAGDRVRRVLKPALEVLAGVPTVAFGFFALTFITPIIRDLWPGFLGDPPGIFSAGAAGLVLGLMIVPIIASISDDAMRSVPAALREGAYALGGTRLQVATRVVLPAALSGIVASFVLGVSRAVGETMVVLIAAGATPNATLNPAESIQTMTAFIATTATGDIGVGTITYKTIFAVGSLLFAMTLVMNLISIRLVRRYREVYE